MVAFGFTFTEEQHQILRNAISSSDWNRANEQARKWYRDAVILHFAEFNEFPNKATPEQLASGMEGVDRAREKLRNKVAAAGLPDDPVKRCIAMAQMDVSGDDIFKAWLPSNSAIAVIKAVGFRVDLQRDVVFNGFKHNKGNCAVVRKVRRGTVDVEMYGYPRERWRRYWNNRNWNPECSPLYATFDASDFAVVFPGE